MGSVKNYLTWLPKVEKIAEGDDVTLRREAIFRLGSSSESQSFLDRRAKLEKSPDVLENIFPSRAPIRPDFSRRLRELLADADPAVRLDTLNFIRSNSHSPPYSQMQVEAATMDAILVRATSVVPDASAALATFREIAGDTAPQDAASCATWSKLSID